MSTNGFEYEPGSGRLVVSANRGALTPDAALADRLWPLIARGVPFAGLLEEALVDGLSRLPDLILFELDAQALRVVVRGELTVRVQLAGGGTAECDGRAVRTWNEQVFEHPVVVTAGELTGTGLPLGSGAVLAAGFRWAADGTTTAALASDGRAGETDEAGGVGGGVGHPIVSDAVSMSKHAVPTMATPPAAAAPPLPEAATRAQLPDTRIEPIDDSFEHLFESTVMRSVEDAAVRAPDEESPVTSISALTSVPSADPATQAATRPGDHDGSTIMAGQLAALRVSTGDPIPAPVGAVTVRPPVLRLSTGQSIEVDRSVVIGRRPQVDRVAGTEIPHLVTVPSPQQDISRSHVAVRPGAAGCVAVDLGSTNGSVIRRAGGEQASLANGTMLDLQPGDTIDLGDGVTAVLLAPS